MSLQSPNVWDTGDMCDIKLEKSHMGWFHMGCSVDKSFILNTVSVDWCLKLNIALLYNIAQQPQIMKYYPVVFEGMSLQHQQINGSN